MKGKILIATIGLLIAAMGVQAQDYKRFSINPEGGLTVGHMSIPTGVDPFYGGHLEFALSPVMTIRGGVNAGTFTDDGTDDFDRGFETSYFQYTLGTNIHLLKPYEFNVSSVNPYFTVNVGQIVADVTTDFPEGMQSQDGEVTTVVTRLGPGLKFKLGNVVDLFLEYTVHATNDRGLDGYVRTETSNSFYSAVTAGLSFKLGSGNEHIIWRADEETAAMETAERSQEELRELRRKIEEQEEADLEGMREEFESFKQEVSDQLANMESRQEEIADRATEARESAADAPDRDTRRDDGQRTTGREHDPQHPAQTTQSGRYYIIVGSYSNESNAQGRRSEFARQGFDAAIYYDENTSVYRVSIEEFSDANAAREKLNEVRQNVFNEAWLLAP